MFPLYQMFPLLHLIPQHGYPTGNVTRFLTNAELTDDTTDNDVLISTLVY